MPTVRFVTLFCCLKGHLDTTLSRISGKSEFAKAILLTVYTTDERLEMSNNTAAPAIRPLALGRKNYLFSGYDVNGVRAAVIYTIVETCKMNGIIRKPISPASSSASPITRPTGSTNCLHGIMGIGRHGVVSTDHWWTLSSTIRGYHATLTKLPSHVSVGNLRRHYVDGLEEATKVPPFPPSPPTTKQNRSCVSGAAFSHAYSKARDFENPSC